MLFLFVVVTQNKLNTTSFKFCLVLGLLVSLSSSNKCLSSKSLWNDLVLAFLYYNWFVHLREIDRVKSVQQENGAAAGDLIKSLISIAYFL
jgi:hypothetical protein